MATKEETLTYKMTSSYLGVLDNLYALGEALGFDHSWADRKLAAIRKDAAKHNGVDLNKA